MKGRYYMANINLIEWIGYAASVLVAISLLMSSIIKLRWYNLIGSLLFSIYGFAIGAFPVGIINSFIIIVNIYYLFKYYSEKEAFKILEISGNDSYLINFFSHYDKEIKKFFPDFKLDFDEHVVAFTVLRNMVPAGIFVGKRINNDTLFIDLDFVTPEYRDLKIGNYIFVENKKYFLDKGFKRFSTFTSNEIHYKYLKKMGFIEMNDDGRDTLVKDI